LLSAGAVILAIIHGVYCDKKKKEYGIGDALKGELQGRWDKPMPS